MGKLIWHEYSRILAITASVYTFWAGFWGLIWRKFFWDFVGGTLRDPGGLQAPPREAFFITVIVKAPVIQIISILLAGSIIALEFPIPYLRGTKLHRTIALRIPLLLVQAFFAVLFYQGTNGAIWSLIAAGCYSRAVMLGEEMEEAKENRSRVGGV
jgi:hypothetical protein